MAGVGVAARLMPQLLQAGVKQLKFVNPSVAIDQLGRKIVFHRERGQWTFEISR